MLPSALVDRGYSVEEPLMVRVIHEEHAFSELFLRFPLARSIGIQADLVDQLFNSSGKRLARILLLMAEFGTPVGQNLWYRGYHGKLWRRW